MNTINFLFGIALLSVGLGFYSVEVRADEQTTCDPLQFSCCPVADPLCGHNHYVRYTIDQQRIKDVAINATDQFGGGDYLVTDRLGLLNPAAKYVRDTNPLTMDTLSPIVQPTLHYVSYRLERPFGVATPPPNQTVYIRNQFETGLQPWTVDTDATEILVPSGKVIPRSGEALLDQTASGPHYLCRPASSLPLFSYDVDYEDEFVDKTSVFQTGQFFAVLGLRTKLCAPATKVHGGNTYSGGINQQDNHLACYELFSYASPLPDVDQVVKILNQFDGHNGKRITAHSPIELCVPTHKQLTP